MTDVASLNRCSLVVTVALVAVLASVVPSLTSYRQRLARREYELCRNMIEDTSYRLFLCRMLRDKYPAQLTPEFYADEKNYGLLAYELSEDGKSWVLFCPGHKHAAAGLGPNLPRTTEKGEFVGLP